MYPLCFSYSRNYYPLCFSYRYSCNYYFSYSCSWNHLYPLCFSYSSSSTAWLSWNYDMFPLLPFQYFCWWLVLECLKNLVLLCLWPLWPAVPACVHSMMCVLPYYYEDTHTSYYDIHTFNEHTMMYYDSIFSRRWLYTCVHANGPRPTEVHKCVQLSSTHCLWHMPQTSTRLCMQHTKSSALSIWMRGARQSPTDPA